MQVLFQKPTDNTYTWSLKYYDEPTPCVVSKSIWSSEYQCFLEMARCANILHQALKDKAETDARQSYGHLSALTEEGHAIPQSVDHVENDQLTMPIRPSPGTMGQRPKPDIMSKFKIPIIKPVARFDVSLAEKVEIDEALDKGTKATTIITKETDE